MIRNSERRSVRLAVERMEARDVPALMTLGPISEINTDHLFRNELPNVSMDSDGDYAAGWGVSSGDVFDGTAAQLVDADGSLAGPRIERLHPVYNGGEQLIEFPATVAAAGNNTTVLVYGLTHLLDPATTQWPYRAWKVVAERFDAAGASLGVIDVAVPTQALQQENNWSAAVAADDAGNFVVTWFNNRRVQEASYDEETGIFTPELWQQGLRAKVFGPSGTALTGDIDVVSETYETQPVGAASNPIRFEVAMAGTPGVGFTVVWDSYHNTHPDYYDVYARSFTSTGGAMSGVVQVNTTAAKNQSSPEVAVSNTGGYVATWADDSDATGVYKVVARQFTQAGAGGSEIVVASGSLGVPSVGVNGSTGEFVVGYTEATAYEAGLIRLRHFSATGAPESSLDFVHNNPGDYGPASDLTVSMSDTGIGVVAWQGTKFDGTFGVWHASIFAQRFTLSTSGGRPLVAWSVSSDTPVLAGQSGADEIAKPTVPRLLAADNSPAETGERYKAMVIRAVRAAEAVDPLLLGVELD